MPFFYDRHLDVAIACKDVDVYEDDVDDHVIDDHGDGDGDGDVHLLRGKVARLARDIAVARQITVGRVLNV